MDRNQAVDAVAQTLGVSSDGADQVLTELFSEYTAQAPSDWNGVQQILDSGSITGLGNDQIYPLLGALKGLAGGTGNADDPHGFFQDPELSNYYAQAQQDPATDQEAGVPIFEGSMIRQVGDDYYIGDTQVWKEGDGETAYYHDGTNSYNSWGRPFGADDAAAPADQSADDGQAQQQQEDPDAWNSYLAENGPRWDGTEESWQQFRDWFLYDAEQHHVGQSAQGFISYAESGDKREVFAAYGITLPAAGPAASDTDRAQSVHRVHQEIMQPALAQFISEHPELAKELGDDVLRRIVAEVTAEHLASGSTAA